MDNDLDGQVLAIEGARTYAHDISSGAVGVFGAFRGSTHAAAGPRRAAVLLAARGRRCSRLVLYTG